MSTIQSYSHEGQDIMVNALLGPRFFLDIGCGDPVDWSNTYALEKLGWTGILIDRAADVERFAATRSSPVFRVDCETLDWAAFLRANACPRLIDYISLDVDYANLQVLNRFPWREYEFKVMTCEHDYYRLGGVIRDREEEVLGALGYRMLLRDGHVSGASWESWWVNERYVQVQEMYRRDMDWADFLSELLPWLAARRQA